MPLTKCGDSVVMAVVLMPPHPRRCQSKPFRALFEHVTVCAPAQPSPETHLDIFSNVKDLALASATTKHAKDITSFIQKTLYYVDG